MWNGWIRWMSPLADRRELGKTLLLFSVDRHASRPPRLVHHPDQGSPHPTSSLARWIFLWRNGSMSCHIRWRHACQACSCRHCGPKPEHVALMSTAVPFHRSICTLDVISSRSTQWTRTTNTPVSSLSTRMTSFPHLAASMIYEIIVMSA